jgi:tropomyosin
LTQLRREADAAIDRADAAEAMDKKYEQQLLEHEQKHEQQILEHVQTVTWLTHRLSLLRDELDIAKSQLQAGKAEGAHNIIDLAPRVPFLEKSPKEANEQ